VDSFQAAGDLITALLTYGLSIGWPPAAAGSFWAMVALWGIVSILFDDEVPRGIPGIEEMNAIRASSAAKYQREQKG
jgi:hypothetical protein